MVLEAVEIISPHPDVLSLGLARPAPDSAKPHTDLIMTSYIKHEHHGVMLSRTTETDLTSTLCAPDVPTAGERIVAPWGNGHVCIWTDGRGQAVMFQTNDPELIAPLSDQQTILCDCIPGGIQATDVFEHPQDVRLIHISLSENDAFDEDIKRRTGEDTVIHIQANESVKARDAWMWQNFEVTYDSRDSIVRIFPGSGDSYASFRIENITGQEATLPLYMSYQQYARRGGVIGWSFMRDAATLSYAQMLAEYPKNGNYKGTPESFEAQVAHITRDTGIEFTDEQTKIYAKLRLIPSEREQVIYDYGPHQPRKNPEETDSHLMHPSTLGEIGLIGQVVLFTQDRGRDLRLQHYSRLQELRRSVIIY